jgi:hypothetical protein
MKHKIIKDKQKATNGFFKMTGVNEWKTTYDDAVDLVSFILRNDLIERSKVIWMPFDDENSNIYRAFRDNGFMNIILSHLAQGGNFFDMNETCDYIISNPPFSPYEYNGKKYDRTKLFDRLFKMRKPFIMLQPIQMWNNYSMVKQLADHCTEISMILPEGRISFALNGEEKHSPSFYSFWLCYKMELQNSMYNIYEI